MFLKREKNEREANGSDSTDGEVARRHSLVVASDVLLIFFLVREGVRFSRYKD